MPEASLTLSRAFGFSQLWAAGRWPVLLRHVVHRVIYMGTAGDGVRPWFESGCWSAHSTHLGEGWLQDWWPESRREERHGVWLINWVPLLTSLGGRELFCWARKPQAAALALMCDHWVGDRHRMCFVTSSTPSAGAGEQRGLCPPRCFSSKGFGTVGISCRDKQRLYQ